MIKFSRYVYLTTLTLMFIGGCGRYAEDEKLKQWDGVEVKVLNLNGDPGNGYMSVLCEFPDNKRRFIIQKLTEDSIPSVGEKWVVYYDKGKLLFKEQVKREN